jgi:hypothetical protein
LAGRDRIGPAPERRGPAAASSGGPVSDLSAWLRIRRAAVAGLLVDGYAPAGDDAGYVLGERLGLADRLGMPTHPGSVAWLVAVGESMGFSCDVATCAGTLRAWRN